MTIYDSAASYIESIFTHEENCIKFARQSAPSHLSHMQLSPMELQLLRLLIKLQKSSKILEVGTFVGTSAIGMALEIKRKGEIHTIEKSLSFHQIALNNLEHAKQSGILRGKIFSYCGNALDTILSFDDDMFDTIFIDAAKSEYQQYLEAALPKLKQGALIIADNTLLFDLLYKEQPNDKKGSKMWSAMREFNTALGNRELFDSILVPTSSGMTIAIKK